MSVLYKDDVGDGCFCEIIIVVVNVIIKLMILIAHTDFQMVLHS